MKKLFALLFLLFVAFQGYGQLPKLYNCQKTTSNLSIDGKAEQAWNIADWTDDFVDIEGDKKPLPRYRTRVKMLWDDDYVIQTKCGGDFITGREDSLFGLTAKGRAYVVENKS